MIKAKRIYEPKKDDNFDIQKVLWEAIQKSITSSTDQTKTLVSEFERMSSDAGVKKLEEKFYQYIKNLRIEKEEIKQDVYKSIEDRVKNIGQRIENHDHKEYLTQEDKDECINSATDMVNEAVTRFDNLFNPFIEQLKIKANKDHSHEEFEELKKEIEENEEELEQAIDMKADKEHTHKVRDVEKLQEKLDKKADKEHKHDEYATRQELEFIAMQKARWAGWGGHVIQQSGVVKAQRSNLNFIGATVTDDPNNNATIVTVTWWGSWTIETIVAWSWISVDSTDPANPIVSATWWWGWAVDSVNWETGVVVLTQDDVLDWTTYKQYSATEKTKLAGIEAGADVTDATNVASAGAFMKSVDDTDDIIVWTTNKFATQAEKDKLWHITVTQAVDLDQMEADIAALANGMVYKWNWDASVGTFPWAWVAQTWWFYTVSVWGTVNSVVFNVDDRLVATADNASTTIYAWNWTKLDATDAVTSVNWAVGNVLVQSLPAVVSSSRTAVNDEVYTVVANATFTDPSPVEWKWYTVIVRNGTATIWGSWYSVAWSEILRIFHSWAWATYLKTPSSWVNTWDQTTIAWITGTKAEFNTACTDWDFQFIDANGNISVVNLIEWFTTTVTAAWTTTLTVSSTYTQEFTGTTTQTVRLPTTSIVAWQAYVINNNSTWAVTVQSSWANTIVVLAWGYSAIFTARVNTPTTAANWSFDVNVIAADNTAILVWGGVTNSPVWTTATGTWAPVRAISPAFTTAVIWTATMAVFNAISTTVSAFWAATTLTVGWTPTTAITHNYSTNATANATTKTINLWTGGVSWSTTALNIGSATSGSTNNVKLNILPGSDTTWDVYYRNSSGFLTRLWIGSTGQVLTVAAWLPSWETSSWWATLWVWYALTWTFVTSSTFTFSGDAWDAEAIERSLFTCLSTGWSTRRIGYVKSASHSAWTVTVTVVTDSDLASWDNTFKVAINRKIEDYEKLITVPWEQVADASNPQGMFYRSLVDAYLLPVNSFVRTAAAWAWAACAWNVYKWATNLFTSAQDMTTSATFDEKRPNTNTITAWDIITLRVTSSVWATNKASDLQVQTFIVPQTLYTIAD